MRPKQPLKAQPAQRGPGSPLPRGGGGAGSPSPCPSGRSAARRPAPPPVTSRIPPTREQAAAENRHAVCQAMAGRKARCLAPPAARRPGPRAPSRPPVCILTAPILQSRDPCAVRLPGANAPKRKALPGVTGARHGLKLEKENTAFYPRTAPNKCSQIVKFASIKRSIFIRE